MSLTSRLSACLLAGLLMVGGSCVPASAPTDTTPITAGEVAAPAQIEVGKTATLSYEVNGGGDSVTYSWYQTFGLVVELLDADKQVARFVAPSVSREQTLRFRVDARSGAGPVVSSTVEVILMADPDFGGVNQPTDPGDTDPKPRVRLKTSMGDIVLELDRERAPISVANFLSYVDSGFYDDTIFHRVIADFVVQGGGFVSGPREKDNGRPSIKNEGNNGLRNVRGSLAMARTNDPDSASSQFYINLTDNDSLDFRADFPGYAVFGRVVEGMSVVDEIGMVETSAQRGYNDVPVEEVTLNSAERE